jgi:hypothetical protein
MKKVFSMLVGLTFIVVTMGFSFAEESAKSKDTSLCEKKRCAQQKCRGMMMHGMMPRSLVETKDGGIVVMTGNKLMKFDKDLNLVREVALPIDTEIVQRMKTHKMGECPYRKRMMQEGGMVEEGSSTKHGSTHRSE